MFRDLVIVRILIEIPQFERHQRKNMLQFLCLFYLKYLPVNKEKRKQVSIIIG